MDGAEGPGRGHGHDFETTDLPPEAGEDRENFRAYGTKSDVLVPLSVAEGPVLGLLTFSVMREERSWPETVVMGFKLIAQVFANALARKRAEVEVTRARLELLHVERLFTPQRIDCLISP